MGKTLITGATGFLGRHLLQQLAERGDTAELRVLASSSVPLWLADLDVDIARGSICEPAVCAEAVAGVSRIYHLAGRVSRNPDDSRQMYAVHVDGTRALCEAARAAGVERVVLASSSGTIAISDSADDVPDETHPTPMKIISRWPYYASKVYQEQVATSTLAGGDTALVTLNPSLLLGPGDERLSSTNDVLRFLERDIPSVPTGGVNFVDARDAAAAFITAMERGRAGERYLLGGPNWTFSEFFGRLERVSKVSAPRLRPPEKLALFGAKVLDAIYRHRGKLPPIEYSSVEMSTYFWYLDDAKARRELDFVTRDAGETLYDTVRYLRDNFLGGADAFATSA